MASARRLGGSLVVLVLLVALVAGGEVVARRVVTDRLSAALAQTAGERPTVTMDGGSALVGLATDHWTGFHVVSHQATVKAQGHRLPVDVDVDARDVSGLVRGNRITAGRLSGHGLATWSALDDVSGATLEPTADGGVQLTKSVEVMGQSVPLAVVGRIALSADGEHVGLVNASLKNDDALAEVFQQYVAPRLATQLGLPHVPGVRFTSVEPTSVGLRVGFDGTNLSVTRP